MKHYDYEIFGYICGLKFDECDVALSLTNMCSQDSNIFRIKDLLRR